MTEESHFYSLQRQEVSSSLKRPDRLQRPNSLLWGKLSLGVKRPGCGSNHSSQSVAKVKHAWSCIFVPPYALMAWCLNEHGYTLAHCATSRKVAGSIPDGVIESFRPHYGPGVGSASNRNEYQEYFPGGKGGRCVGLTTLPPSYADCLTFGSLNLPEPPGSVRACNGIALPLHVPPSVSFRQCSLLHT